MVDRSELDHERFILNVQVTESIKPFSLEVSQDLETRRTLCIHFQMELDESHQPKGIFECQLCKLSLPYSYFGQKPPHAHSVVLLEESYIAKDPFSPDKEKFLILGSHCYLCKQVVCVGTECSLFYSKRFCLPCFIKNKGEFPKEIQQDFDKRKSQTKS
ncbi:cysteine-rich DPF motif domain-containing protein 1 isoform X1 [Pelobates fuscus]|uniref:cysteine-rich DPF motif domain-containing protein 1 isoform X1 n=2 Tax=Pelobates fuscus TaxID=191477 RepID=UPI002FE4474A